MYTKKKETTNLFRLKNVHICTRIGKKQPLENGQDIHVLCKLTPY